MTREPETALAGEERPVAAPARDQSVEASPETAEGFRKNWKQMALLGALVAFTGSMVGLERPLISLLAKSEFGLASSAAALSFLIAFGLAKAFANLGAGGLADRYGRRRVLIAGWLVGIPAPLMVALAPSWSYVIAANALLGISQGLAWSMALNMKIDLAGPKRRGLAVGFNESVGYMGVATMAYFAASLASTFGLRPVPFLIGTAIAVVGFTLAFLTKETWPRREAEGDVSWRSFATNRRLILDPTVRAASFGGFATNLKDGLLWGLLPLLLIARGVSLTGIGLVVALYPLVWAVTQFASGPLSDRFGRRTFIVPGFLIQALGLGLLVTQRSYASTAASAVVLGVGTGMVYPTLIALASDAAIPRWRASAIGAYRFIRDLGYVGGGLLGGLVADLFGIEIALGSGVVFVLAAGAVIAVNRRRSTEVRLMT